MGEKNSFVVSVLFAMVTLQIYFGYNIQRSQAILKSSVAVVHQSINVTEKSNNVINGAEFVVTAPIWSALAQQQLQKQLQHDDVISMDVRFRNPGMDEIVTARRSAMELMTYGISGVLPHFSEMLPAIRFDIPFTNTTQLQTANVEGLVDTVFDLFQCDNNDTSGYFDACYGDGRDWVKQNCYQKHHNRDPEYRTRNYPKPGHERLSCNDKHFMEQLVAAQVLDYLIMHGDRFYKTFPSNNLFFFKDERPLRFVSIDHHGKFTDFFGRMLGYKNFAQHKRLLNFELPPTLRKDLQRAAFFYSKDDFVQKFNDTIRGQLDNLNKVSHEVYAKEVAEAGRLEILERHPAVPVTDVLFYRLQSLASFYKITRDE